ncbi:MAG: hypothetical protein G8237_09940, partial [Magnetococcales bacterium]|nr:hypothetical protein [Magnetococcales bacterium]
MVLERMRPWPLIPTLPFHLTPEIPMASNEIFIQDTFVRASLLNEAGRVEEAWSLIYQETGDTYAKAATKIIGGSVLTPSASLGGYLYLKGGGDPEKFMPMAQRHQKQYIEQTILKDDFLNTNQIERSYIDAAKVFDIPKTAIPALVSNVADLSEILPDMLVEPHWGMQVGMSPGRISEIRNTPEGLSVEDARRQFRRAFCATSLDQDQSVLDLLRNFPVYSGGDYTGRWEYYPMRLNPKRGNGADAAWRGTIPPPPNDPLVLDLDGDGIEVTAADTIVVFDHDGDGVKAGTGWIRPDDGWLVLDRNGNGTIDSGGELFGVNTLKVDGQLARDGFDALRELDDNQDGRIDQQDGDFAALQIWRDLNQDGISQSAELTTLADHGIMAIGVSSIPVRIDLGSGNIQTAAGTFTYADGRTGNTGATGEETSDGTIANLDLMTDIFHSTFTDRIPLTEQARRLPNVRGTGRVRDLSEAISLSSDLAEWVELYAQQTTRDGQLAMLDRLMELWADTSEMKSLKMQAESLASVGVRLVYSLDGLVQGTPEYESFVRKLGIVERFMGFTYGGQGGMVSMTPLNVNAGIIGVRLWDPQSANISQAYELFKADVYESLLLETRLSGYLNQLDLVSRGGRVVPDFGNLQKSFESAIARNPRDGVIDLIEFLNVMGETNLKNQGWHGAAFLAAQLDHIPELGAFTEDLNHWTVRFAGPGDAAPGRTSGQDFLVGAGRNDEISGGDGDDILAGGAGNDTLHGENGADVLVGGPGNDTLSGSAGSDTYLFGAGSGQDKILEYHHSAGNIDTLRMTGLLPSQITFGRNTTATGWGQDLVFTINGTTDRMTVFNYFLGEDFKIEKAVFDNGTIWSSAEFDATQTVLPTGASWNGLSGNDVIDLRSEVSTVVYGPGWGNNTGDDTYLFGIGAGQDVLYEYDATAGNTDTVRIFGKLPAEVSLGRSVESGNMTRDLVIVLNGTSDRLTVKNHFFGSVCTIERIEFDNGTVWGAAEFNQAMLVPAVSGAVTTTTASDIIDLRNGVSSQIYGPSGNVGSDTWLFGVGAGQDMVNAYNETSGNVDTVRIMGKLPSEVTLGRSVSGTNMTRDLVIALNGTSDRLTVQNHFLGNAYTIERIEFEDGTVWGAAEFNQAMLVPAVSGAVTTTTASDIIDLRNGVSSQIDAPGSSTGNDTWLFGAGAGQDMVRAYNETSGNVDTVRIMGRLPSEVTLGRSVSGTNMMTRDLVIALNGTSDRLTVQNHFLGSA